MSCVFMCACAFETFTAECNTQYSTADDCDTASLSREKTLNSHSRLPALLCVYCHNFSMWLFIHEAM